MSTMIRDGMTTMLARLVRVLSFCGILLLLNACSTAQHSLVIRSDIDALATQDAQEKRHFVIVPANKEIMPQDLQFLEFKGYIEKALLQRGFVKANQFEQGDVFVYLNYGVGEPQTQQYSYEVPIWSDFGYYPYSRRYGFYPRMSYGVAGYAQRVQTYKVYTRYLTLEAYDMPVDLNQQAAKQLWKISVRSQGQSNDLRFVFPYMVTAMQPYLGRNSGHMLSVDIDEFNPLLRDIQLGNVHRLPATPAVTTISSP